MINSNKRKLALAGWLKKYNDSLYDSPLKMQKFLFFYETFSKVLGKDSDFSYLKGYKKGPVFSNVWGDYTKEKNDFNIAIEESFKNNYNIIDEEIATKCSFIVKTLTVEELSDLTHKLNIWSSKKDRIISGEKQVDLDENDFNENDKNFILAINSLYTSEMIKNSVVIPYANKNFVISIKNLKLLTEEKMDILSEIAKDEALNNPVFVEIDEKGRLIID